MRSNNIHDGIRHRIVLIALVCAGLPALSALANSEFDLRIDLFQPTTEPWPLIAGLPFPEGALNDPEQIRIRHNGQAVPAQFDVAATWSDGSIRWVLAGFTAPPDGAYQVQFGDDIVGAPFDSPLQIEEDDEGRLIIDTGEVRYEFTNDHLLPEKVTFGETLFFSNSGAGAYLVDNQGREARVAGDSAEIASEFVKPGPARAVLHREGWYVTDSGERLARARIWFYFAANSPMVRITHSLVLTEDTNEVWVADYGLKFDTPTQPRKVAFGLGEPGEETWVERRPAQEEEVAVLQSTYPHFLESESQALLLSSENDGEHPIIATDVASDWGHADYGEFGLTLVLPWLAQQFPKEIAFGPDQAKVAFWSGRSGRELDFRTSTLVEEYWQAWAHRVVENSDGRVKALLLRHWEEEREPEGAEALARYPSNAQGVALTHDLWILPTAPGTEPEAIRSLALTAARPPLVLADPKWLTSTQAIGWPLHYLDTERFPEHEEWIAGYWDRLMRQFETLPRTGVLGWGSHPYLSQSKLFRKSSESDYGLRRSVWGLYARSGERRYYDFGSHHNRWLADLRLAHWEVPNKTRGGWIGFDEYTKVHLPLVWGEQTRTLSNDETAASVQNFYIDYYLTGNEYARDVVRMIGEAMKAEWWDEATLQTETGRVLERWHVTMPIGILAELYAGENDEAYRNMAMALAGHLIDFDNPNALTEKIGGGAIYKYHRNLLALALLYQTTGEPMLREALEQALDYHYKFYFNRTRSAFSSNHIHAWLFTFGYRLTGRPEYLGLVHHIVQSSVDTPPSSAGAAPFAAMNPAFAIPTALGLLAEAGEPVPPFLLLDFEQEDSPRVIEFENKAGQTARFAFHLLLLEDAVDDAPEFLIARVRDDGSAEAYEEFDLQVENAFDTHYQGRRAPRARFVRFSLSEEALEGRYQLTLPNAQRVRLLESNISSVGLE